ncbi:MAG: DUF5615 family PIN-like protein [Ktedonobacterales bacterium]
MKLARDERSFSRPSRSRYERARALPGDADFNNWIIKGILRRQPLVDFQTGEAAGLRGVADPEVLTRVSASGRVLVSHDYATMPGHLAEFLASGQHIAGVLLLHQTLPIAQAIEILLLVWEASEPDDWRDKLTYLP